MSWINYLLEANLYLVLFYAVYYFVLRKDTYYQLNRIYLLTSSLIAFVIPLVQVGILKPTPVTTTIMRAAVASAQVTNYVIRPGHAVDQTTPINYYLLVYIIVAVVLTMALGIRLWQLVKLAGAGKRVAKSNFKMIEIADEQHAFSFFNYLFIGSKLSTSSTIIKHELVHIRQKHSVDIIYLEVIKIICWFNPIAYLLQNSIKEVHEYIADSLIAAEEQDVNHYTDFLISNAYGLPSTALTNNFFNKNLLKNRIMMLHQKRSGSLARLKYLVALPLLAGMLCLSTLGFTKDYSVIDLAPNHSATLRITQSAVKQASKKQLLITNTNHLTGLTDKISIKLPEGSTKDYTADNLTNDDTKTLTKHGIDVKVVSKAQIDTTKYAIQVDVPPSVENQITIDTVKNADQFQAFYKFIGQRVRYPAVARANNVQGRVFAVFNVNDDKTISNVKITKGLMDIQNNEVARVLKLYTAADDLKPGVNYAIVVYFGLQDANGKYEDSKPYKAPKDYDNSNYKPNNYKTTTLSEVVVVGFKN